MYATSLLPCMPLDMCVVQLTYGPPLLLYTSQGCAQALSSSGHSRETSVMRVRQQAGGGCHTHSTTKITGI
jgi:hypothetical protein